MVRNTEVETPMDFAIVRLVLICLSFVYTFLFSIYRL